MVKKISHIILSCLLLIATMGMAVSKHYCGGELVSVSLYGQDNHCCDMGDCCQNETHIYQMKEDFSVPVISTVPVLAEFEILGHDLLHSFNLTAPETEPVTTAFSESPPLLPIQKTLALKQVFLL